MRLITTIVVAAVLALSGCAAGPSAKNGDDPYGVLYGDHSKAAYATSFPVASPAEANARGDAAVQGGDLDRALFEYVRSLELDGQQPAVFYNIGAIHDSRRSYRLAELAYRWALKLDPEHVNARAGLGVLLLRARHYDAAKAELNAAVARSNDRWRAHNALGIIADLEGRFDDAAAHYKAALSVVPTSTMVLNNLGYSRYLAGDWSQARETLGKVLRIDAKYALAWRNLGLVYARLGEHGRAVEALSRTMSAPEVHNDLGYLSMLDQDYERAEALLGEAMRLSPSFYSTAHQNARRVESLRQDESHGLPVRD